MGWHCCCSGPMKKMRLWVLFILNWLPRLADAQQSSDVAKDSLVTPVPLSIWTAPDHFTAKGAQPGSLQTGPAVLSQTGPTPEPTTVTTTSVTTTKKPKPTTISSMPDIAAELDAATAAARRVLTTTTTK